MPRRDSISLNLGELAANLRGVAASKDERSVLAAAADILDAVDRRKRRAASLPGQARVSIRSKPHLTPEQVAAIFQTPGRTENIAAQFGVHASTVHGIKTRRSWRRLTAGLPDGPPPPPRINAMQKLTGEQVAAIYQDARSLEEIARSFDCSSGLVSMIKRRKLHAGITAGLAVNHTDHKRVLTNDQVIALFQAEGGITELAAKFGCSQANVSMIRNRKIHRELTAGLPDAPPYTKPLERGIKFSRAQVREIYRADGTNKAVAALYGISPSHVQGIRDGTRRSDVTGASAWRWGS